MFYINEMISPQKQINNILQKNTHINCIHMGVFSCDKDTQKSKIESLSNQSVKQV